MPLLQDDRSISLDPHAILPPRQLRLQWESFGDIRTINSWLLIICVALTACVATLSALMIRIYSRPPYILTQDEGFVMWRTTEVFKLQPQMIRGYLEMVLGKLLNVTPGYYDLAPLQHLVAPDILDAFAGVNRSDRFAHLRMRADLRQVWSLYELRRFQSPRYPQFVGILARGEETSYAERKDKAGNVSYLPESEVVVFAVYLKEERPNPQNPWGLVTVGMTRLDRVKAEQQWADSAPLQ